MKTRNFIVKIEDKKIIWKSENHKNLFLKFIAQFSDGEYSLTIESNKQKRSDQQNNYYWLYLGIVSDESGYLPFEIHEWAKGKFLTTDIKEIFGDKVRQKKSTTKLTKSQFADYLLNIEIATGVPLPDTTEFFGYSYHK